MWGFTAEALERIRGNIPVNANPEEAAELKAKREAEKKVEESGQGECSFCHQEILKNEVLGVWESDTLIGYCTEARDHKHKPKIVWKVNDEQSS